MINLSVDIGPLLQAGEVVKSTARNLEKREVQHKLRQSVTAEVPEQFGAYVDLLASSRPKLYWHLYESGQVGHPTGRLFMVRPSTGSNAVMLAYAWDFLPATEPNRQSMGSSMYSGGRRIDADDTRTPQVFRNKAWLVENGATVYMKPVRAKAMAFTVTGGLMVFTKQPITINFSENPAAGQFEQTAAEFVAGPMQSLLEREAEKLERHVNVKLDHFVGQEAKRGKKWVRIGARMNRALKAKPLDDRKVRQLLERSTKR